MASERIPLWDSVTHPLANVLEFAFGCHHRKLSRVFTIDGHSYKVCCELRRALRIFAGDHVDPLSPQRCSAALRRLQARAPTL